MVICGCKWGCGLHYDFALLLITFALMKLIAAIIIAILPIVDVFAQGCVMCSATIEANKVDGGNAGAGINMGVAYLSFFPYLILGFFGFVFYRIYKKEKENQ